MDGLLLVACRTLDAYTVEGAGGRGRSPTDRRSFGPGARTETHASRPEVLAPLPVGEACRSMATMTGLPPPPPRCVPPAGQGPSGGGERRPWRGAGTRPGLGTRPAAWSVRAAREKA